MILSSTTAFSAKHSDEYTFTSLANCKQEKLPLVKKIFSDVMSPHYGEQTALIQDIEARKDRKTEILSYNKQAVGCIIYKRELNGDKQLEITLSALANPEDAAKGYRSKLVERIEEIAKEQRAEAIVYKLPVKLVDHVKYFEHKGFAKTAIEGTQECLLTKQLEQKRRRVASPVKQAAPPPRQQEPQPIRQQVRQNELTLKNQYIDPIRRGTKTVEVRINSGGPRNFKTGETLRLFSGQNSVTSTISKIERFASFRELLTATDYKICVPDARNLDDAVRIYESIPNYTQRANQNGVLAIHLVNPH